MPRSVESANRFLSSRHPSRNDRHRAGVGVGRAKTWARIAPTTTAANLRTQTRARTGSHPTRDVGPPTGCRDAATSRLSVVGFLVASRASTALPIRVDQVADTGAAWRANGRRGRARAKTATAGTTGTATTACARSAVTTLASGTRAGGPMESARAWTAARARTASSWSARPRRRRCRSGFSCSKCSGRDTRGCSRGTRPFRASRPRSARPTRTRIIT